MNIIINNKSMQPIYEQIVEKVKAMILHGDLKEGDMLPSVRVLAKELKISALTVKKAYDTLEEDGFTSTVHGKGSFIVNTNQSLIEEEMQKEIEQLLEKAVRKAKVNQLDREQVLSLLDIILEDIYD